MEMTIDDDLQNSIPTNHSYQPIDIEEEDEDVLIEPDNDDIIRSEYQQNNSIDDRYQSQTKLVIQKRLKLLGLMETFPEISKGLKLTIKKVYKINDPEELDNIMLNFSSTSSLRTLTNIFYQGAVRFAEVIETTASKAKFLAGRFFLNDYTKIVAQDPDLIPICKELAVAHSESFNQFLTPEYRLMFLLANDAILTNNYNLKKISGGIPSEPQPQDIPQNPVPEKKDPETVNDTQNNFNSNTSSF
jgi:hypothetical protein